MRRLIADIVFHDVDHCTPIYRYEWSEELRSIVQTIYGVPSHESCSPQKFSQELLDSSTTEPLPAIVLARFMLERIRR